jgi:hypothetical protein
LGLPPPVSRSAGGLERPLHVSQKRLPPAFDPELRAEVVVGPERRAVQVVLERDLERSFEQNLRLARAVQA